jgi:hypothetical protein
MSFTSLIAGCSAPPAAPVPGDVAALEAQAPSTITVAVWMDADNSLESLAPGDLDELEVAAGPTVQVAVQLDRIPGGLLAQGDWAGTVRLEVAPDRVRGRLASTVVEDLGEVDMGDGDALADFLVWADDRYPADRFVVILWDHGGGYWIASDDTSHDKILIPDGELSEALQAVVDARGAKVDVLGFDACNMAGWEVGSVLADQVEVMTASEAWTGSKGYAYDQAFTGLPADPTPQDLGDRLAWTAGVLDGERTHSAVDLGRIDGVSAAFDALGAAFLADPDGLARFAAARAAARGADLDYGDFWKDGADLARVIAADPSATADEVAAAQGLSDALGDAVIASYTRPELAFAGGLTVFTDTSDPGWLERYASAPWSASSRWDDLLMAVAAAAR